MVYIVQIYRVVIKDILNLRRFPFDRQIFRLGIKSFHLKFVKWFGSFDDLPSGFQADPYMSENDNVVAIEGDEWAIGWTSAECNTHSHPRYWFIYT